MAKSGHRLMGWAQMLAGILALLLILKDANVIYPVIIFALVFIAMGLEHVQNKR